MVRKGGTVTESVQAERREGDRYHLFSGPWQEAMPLSL